MKNGSGDPKDKVLFDWRKDVGEQGEHLTILGDSLTCGMKKSSSFRRLFAKADVIAKDGETVAWGIEQLKTGQQRPVVAFLLGTNCGTTTEELEKVYAAFRGKRLVVMTVDVPTERPHEHYARREPTNRAVREFAARHAEVSVFSFQNRAKASDGVHCFDYSPMAEDLYDTLVKLEE